MAKVTSYGTDLSLLRALSPKVTTYGTHSGHRPRRTWLKAAETAFAAWFSLVDRTLGARKPPRGPPLSGSHPIDGYLQPYRTGLAPASARSRPFVGRFTAGRKPVCRQSNPISGYLWRQVLRKC